jgi:DNA-binding transcriptional regulator YhcF (GntR family)
MEKQLMMLEKRLGEIIYEAKNAGLGCEDLVEMVQTLYTER